MAAKPTHSRLTIGYGGAMAAGIGEEHGVAEAALDALAERVAGAHARIAAEAAAGGQRWLGLPDDGPLARAIQAYAAETRGRYRDVLLVAAGDAALGPRAIVGALSDPFLRLRPAAERPGARLTVLADPDSDGLAAALDALDPAGLLVVVVGDERTSTAEVLAAVREALAGVGGVAEREGIVAVGAGPGPTTGGGAPTFPLPAGVPARQSVLGAPGLLPAALAGVDIQALLAGAIAMRDRCRDAHPRQNPADLLAGLAYLADRGHGKSVLATVPAGDALAGLADWFGALWAGALRRSRSTRGEEVAAGQTPVTVRPGGEAAFRLLTEGPNDALAVLLGVGGAAGPLAATGSGGRPGASWGRLGPALRRVRRPAVTVETPVLDAFALGEFFFLHQLQAVMAAALYEVDPFAPAPAGERGTEEPSAAEDPYVLGPPRTSRGRLA